MLLPPLSYPLNIHSYAYSLWFCLYKLENSNSSFGVQHTSPQVTLCISPLGARQDLKGWWDWVLRRISIVWHGNCLRETHYYFLGQCRVSSLRQGGKANATLSGDGTFARGKEATSLVKRLVRIQGLNVPSFIRDFIRVFPPHGIPFFSDLCPCPCFYSKHPVSWGAQFSL